ncbi:uncharacterized protein [Amphiura filiformis]|uniref:uncharacterized protein n=1 Tax=Amphiura filiformis TaxID=82378 RepID=UPI003B22385B
MADGGPARVILWGTPRCLSTAFLKAMTHVDDSIVWHEPYLYARRLGTDGADREKFRIMAEQGMKAKGVGGNFDAIIGMAKMLPFGYVGSEVSYQWVKEQLQADAPGKKLIFNKDMVEGIVDKYDAIPEGFRHVFLLRHPLKVFPSFKNMAKNNAPPGMEGVDLRKLPGTGFMPAGYFYKELDDLYEYLKDSKPVVICTDDLQKNPEGVMKAYCKEIGIQYTEKILNWTDDGDAIMQKWMIAKESAMMLSSTTIHKNAFGSTGFGEPSELPDKSGMDEDIVEVVDKCMSYYEKMHKDRLQVE